MLGYVDTALTCFKHTYPLKAHHFPYPHILPKYGAKFQYPHDGDNEATDPVDNAEKKFIQQVTSTFFYYSQAIDPMKLIALSIMVMQQA